MTLAGGNEINQVHDEVFNFRVWLVARMLGFGLWWWSSFRIASIHGNGWIHGADHIICIAGDVFNCSYDVRVVVSGQQLFHIWGIGKPGNTMNVWTSTVLPLKSKPVVCCSQNTNVEGIDELVDPVSKNQSAIAAMAAFLLKQLCWSFGQISFASSGHWVSAALCVKKTVGSPRASTMDISLLLCLNQYCPVPHRLPA